LQNSIKAELLNIKKDGYISVLSSIRYDTVSNRADLVSGKSDMYTENVTGQMLLIKTEALEKSIAEKVITPYNGENVSIKDISSMAISFVAGTRFSLNLPVSIFVEGSSKMIYKIDKDALQTMLSSKNSEEFNSIIQTNFKNEVDSATSSLSPFWINSYPANKNKIDIVENNI
jgi:hypothetical protein